MGTQIHIKKEEMEAAGWQHSVEVEQYFDHVDDCGNEVYADVNEHVYSNGEDRLYSYSPDGFCWDCNDWGPNKERFRRLGLLDLPHIMC